MGSIKRHLSLEPDHLIQDNFQFCWWLNNFPGKQPFGLDNTQLLLPVWCHCLTLIWSLKISSYILNSSGARGMTCPGGSEMSYLGIPLPRQFCVGEIKLGINRLIPISCHLFTLLPLYGRFQSQAGGLLVSSSLKQPQPSLEKSFPLCFYQALWLHSSVLQISVNNHVSYWNHSVWIIIAINLFNIRDYFHQIPVLELISSPEQKRQSG